MSLLIAFGLPLAVRAQTTTPLAACQPPAADEYLLLVVVSDQDALGRLQQALPPNVNAPTCDYLGTPVARMGGFGKVEDANTWSKYITETVGLQAFVAHPAGEKVDPVATAPTVPTRVSPATTTTSDVPGEAPAATPVAGTTSRTFNPQPLGPGYAVLVNYFNQPNIAIQIRRLLGDLPLGLVAYNQRPYLLAQQASDLNEATSTLEMLSSRGFQVLLVDSQTTVLLTSDVAKFSNP